MFAHANVENTCFRILRAKGWELSVEGEYDESGLCIDPETLFYNARRDGFRMSARNPIELLGLVAIHEYVKPESPETGWWWAVEGPDIREELWARAFDATDEPPATSE